MSVWLTNDCGLVLSVILPTTPCAISVARLRLVKAWLNKETLLRKQCFLLCFPGWLNWETYVSDAKFVSGKQKCFWLQPKTFFVFRATKFVSATHVSRAAKLENICIRNNVSATMFPSLARPLVHNKCGCSLPQYQRQRKCFWELKKALGHAALCGLLSTTAN